MRKAAQHGVTLMLRNGGEVGEGSEELFHPTCKLVAKHCKLMMESKGEYICHMRVHEAVLALNSLSLYRNTDIYATHHDPTKGMHG